MGHDAGRRPTELVWLEIDHDATTEMAGGRGPNPAPGTPAVVVDRHPPGAAVLRRAVEQLDRIDRDRRPAMRGTDLSIRRVAFVPFDAAAPLLADLVPRRGRVVFDPRPQILADEVVEVRFAGRVCAHHLGPALAVDLVLTPWSAWQSELRLHVHARRTPVRLPRHYFDVAHPALAALRDQIEQRVPDRHVSTRR